jgi:O-antigen/teichoic acid export membrane protein
VIALAVAGVRRPDALLLAYTAGLLVTAALSWRQVRVDVPSLRLAPWRVSAAAVRDLARVGGTLQATHLVAQLGDQGLRLILGSAHGSAAIGIYDLASRAAIVPRSLMASLLVALVPFAAARATSGGRAELSDSLRRSTRYATLTLAAGTAAGWFAAEPFMSVWLGGAGPAVDDARHLLQGLVLALGIQSVTSPMVALARAMGRPGGEALATTLAQPLALLGAAWTASLVPAVLAYAAVTTAAAGVLWWWLKHRLAVDGLPARETLALVAVAAGAAVAAAVARAAADALAIGPVPTLIAVGAVAVATVGGLALATGAISHDERRLLGDVVLGR